MTYAYWYIFLAMLLPYGFTVLAKFGPGYDNRSPRAYLESLEGWRLRSHWVQLNSFEIFGPFAVSVIIAQLAHAPQNWVDILALSFLITRVFYGMFYLFNHATLRSLSWFAGLLCIIGLYMLAAFKGVSV